LLLSSFLSLPSSEVSLSMSFLMELFSKSMVSPSSERAHRAGSSSEETTYFDEASSIDDDESRCQRRSSVASSTSLWTPPPPHLLPHRHTCIGSSWKPLDYVAIQKEQELKALAPSSNCPVLSIPPALDERASPPAKRHLGER
jgi:hypothetical protein